MHQLDPDAFVAVGAADDDDGANETLTWMFTETFAASNTKYTSESEAIGRDSVNEPRYLIINDSLMSTSFFRSVEKCSTKPHFSA